MYNENFTNIKVLIIEDEINISNAEKKYLEVEGFNVEQAFDGLEAINMIKKDDYGIIILDLMLPELSGEKVMEFIRSRTDTPVIMVTAKIDESEILDGLKLGADDYITKPFSLKILVQKVKTILRRVEKLGLPKSDKIYFDNGRVTISFDDNTFIKDGETINLTSNEFQIIKTLFSNPNKIFTRDEIIELSFGYDYEAFDRAIDTHIKNIRHKIEDNPKKPRYIKTIYGVGYKLGVYDEA
ncbi:response regulator transcription factor [uncultured Finegoldia sp.]|uniref:response regulator transcription factor n=1 Tax=uncultured Finegoldia sp. TaxID=328009 RepID=UPI002633580E|nr:response regulator transcription factor [uncultured Finegoldia sp.]